MFDGIARKAAIEVWTCLLFRSRGFFGAMCWLIGIGITTPLLLGAAPKITYERDIRPIFKTHCFHCHGEGGRVEGGLDLRLQRLVMRGGDSGEVVVPGDPAASYLLERMRSGEMPPEEIKVRPTAEEIGRIDEWIAAGAKTGRPEPADLDPDQYITEEERNYWAFQTVRKPQVPPVRHAQRVRTPIDCFVLTSLEREGLGLAPEAERRVLIRRLYFDLHGLPPSPQAVEAFVSDERPDAYERLVDALLASPRYGQRWGRWWLDVAGYADSEGYTDDDPERPWAYKYRDYVIAALGQDKPFDQFIVEQLAGDELVSQPFSNLSPDDREKLVATGFLRMAPDGTGVSGVNAVVAKDDVIAATLEIVGSSLLGLTVGCARCHNHRYDPISQQDYYALRAIFEPAFRPGEWLPPQRRRISLYTDTDRERAAEIEQRAQQILSDREKKQTELIAATLERELQKLADDVRDQVREAVETPPGKRTDEQRKLLKLYPSVNVTPSSLYLFDRKAADELQRLADEAAKVRATKPKEEFVRALWEPAGAEPPATHLLARGDPEQPKQEVLPQALRILTQHHPVDISDNQSDRPTTGRRLAYARWLVSGDHPLVARVIVNRVWSGHFGRGIVETPGDFGRLGVPPTNPQLLDWLAAELVESGWSLKHLHRLILTSSVYRQSARRSPQGDAIDQANRLLWRWPLQRLDAETFRDALLAVSGELLFHAGGPPVPVMADRVGQFVIGKENLNAGRPGPVIDMKGEQFRRTIYVQVRRSRRLSAIEPFDLPRMSPNCTVRHRSTVSTQSLLLMNSLFVMDRARAMAQRAAVEGGEDWMAQVRWLWLSAYGRQPSEAELNSAQRFLQVQRKLFAENPPPVKEQEPAPTPELEAMTSLCHAVISSNEFLYVE